MLDLSQFMIGAHIGLLLKPEELKHKNKNTVTRYYQWASHGFIFSRVKYAVSPIL